MSEALALRPEPRLFLGRYRAVRPLGSGGSGSVWLARDEQGGRDVAVKVVPREGKAGERARREAQAMSKLDHPACPRVYACGRDAENVYIAYGYVPGSTFRQSLRAGRVTDAVAVEVAVQVLDGLAHAHDRGIVHRDVKPANVLLADDGDDEISVRILDFGLARFAEGETLTAAGDVPGTLAYIAPERLHGEPAGPAGDVWSVGVLLYEALAGRHPFWRPSLGETAEAIAQGPPPLRTERPDLPDRLLAAVDRALLVDPKKRPSAAKLARMLGRTRGDDRGATRDIVSVPRQLLPAVAAGIYAAGAAALLPFYPERGALPLGVAAAALTLGAPRFGLAFALAVPIFPLGNVALGLALLYTALAAAAWLALVLTKGPARRAIVTAAGVVLLVVAHAVRAGPIGHGITGSRHPLAVAEALLTAAPQSLAWQVPLAALVAAALPWTVRRTRELSRRAVEARTYTG
ncbi:MAG: serine/threonine-protein kinase [Gaiellaceae bacterium]